MKKKGFTLIELIAVVIILGVILTILIPNMVNVVDTQEELALDTQVESLKIAGREYFTTNRTTLPIDYKGQTREVLLKTLIEKGHIEKIEYNKKECDTEKSKVIAMNEGKGKYQYSATLVCDDITQKSVGSWSPWIDKEKYVKPEGNIEEEERTYYTYDVEKTSNTQTFTRTQELGYTDPRDGKVYPTKDWIIEDGEQDFINQNLKQNKVLEYTEYSYLDKMYKYYRHAYASGNTTATNGSYYVSAPSGYPIKDTTQSAQAYKWYKKSYHPNNTTQANGSHVASAPADYPIKDTTQSAKAYKYYKKDYYGNGVLSASMPSGYPNAESWRITGTSNGASTTVPASTAGRHISSVFRGTYKCSSANTIYYGPATNSAVSVYFPVMSRRPEFGNSGYGYYNLGITPYLDDVPAITLNSSQLSSVMEQSTTIYVINAPAIVVQDSRVSCSLVSPEEARKKHYIHVDYNAITEDNINGTKYTFGINDNYTIILEPRRAALNKTYYYYYDNKALWYRILYAPGVVDSSKANFYLQAPSGYTTKDTTTSQTWYKYYKHGYYPNNTTQANGKYELNMPEDYTIKDTTTSQTWYKWYKYGYYPNNTTKDKGAYTSGPIKDYTIKDETSFKYSEWSAWNKAEVESNETRAIRERKVLKYNYILTTIIKNRVQSEKDKDTATTLEGITEIINRKENTNYTVEEVKQMIVKNENDEVEGPIKVYSKTQIRYREVSAN